MTLEISTDYVVYGVLLLVILVAIFILFKYGFKREKEPHNFESLRKEVKEGYNGLLRAAESFQNINEVLNEVDKRMK